MAVPSNQEHAHLISTKAIDQLEHSKEKGGWWVVGWWWFDMHDIDEWKGAKGCFCLDGYMRDTGPDILHYTLIMSEYYNIYNNIS